MMEENQEAVILPNGTSIPKNPRPLKTRDEMYHETDMLRGNINRMCVTDDKDELDSMYQWALFRLKRIRAFNEQERFTEKQEPVVEEKKNIKKGFVWKGIEQ